MDPSFTDRHFSVETESRIHNLIIFVDLSNFCKIGISDAAKRYKADLTLVVRCSKKDCKKLNKTKPKANRFNAL